MNQSFDVSTIVFAALAVFVVWKLRSVLGTRTGEERPPFNPFARKNAVDPKTSGPQASEANNVITLPGAAKASARPVVERDPDRWKGVVEPGSPVIEGLDRVAAVDSSFSGQGFLDGARMAYEMIVSAFAKGDRAALSGLLAKDVYDGFVAAIAEREARGETVENTFVASDKAVIEDAQLRGQSAQITVRFESQQINLTRKRDGSPVAGTPEGAGTVIDHWTFAREVTARDPNWKLIATNAE